MNLNLEQLQMSQLYKIKGQEEEFNNIQDAAIKLGKVSLNENYYGRPFRKYDEIEKFKNNLLKTGRFSRSTLFNEIECINPPVHPEVMRILIEGLKRKKVIEKVIRKKDNKLVNRSYYTIEKIVIPPKDLAKEVVNAAKSHIENSWDSEKIKIIQHSSGWDSRLISACIRKIYEERGKDWLGEFYFICWQPEINDFLKIMDFYGWKKDHIIEVRKDVNTNYYADVISFDECGKTHSEGTRFGTTENVFYKEIDKISTNYDNIQIISGNHSDEVFEKNQETYAEYYVKFLSDITHKRNKFHSHITPYTSKSMLDVTTKYDIKIENRAETKIEAACSLYPALRNIPVTVVQDLRQTEEGAESDRLTKETSDKMHSDFIGSIYYKKLGLNEPPFPNRIYYDNHPTYKNYIKAAICEYLLKNGVIINGLS